MLVADYPTTAVDATAGQLEQIEYALRNPAMSEMIEGYDVGPADAPYPFEIVLHQMIPLREYPYPWVLVMVDYGERSVLPFDSQRAAELELTAGLAYLESEYSGLSADDEDDSDDD